MTWVALILCLLLCAVGALGIASPSRLVGVVRRFQTTTGLFVAAALRVGLGAALFFSAPDSRAPELISVVGIVILVLGVATPFFGVRRFRGLLDRWSARGSVFIRGWALLALAFSVSLIYAILPQLAVR